MKTNALKLLVLGSGAFFFTTGFIFGDNPEETTQAFLNDTKQNVRATPVKMEPLPEEKLYEPYKYEAAESPFDLKPFATENRTNNQPTDTEAKPKQEECAECLIGAPKAHEPYFLENYDLSQLAMVGTIQDERKKGELIALIKTPVGTYPLKKGEYIGKNNGLVNTISQTQITITEKHRLPGGNWSDAGQVLKLFDF